MKIITRVWLLSWLLPGISMFTNPSPVLAREPAGPEAPAPTPTEQGAVATSANTEDYTAYIRPLDKLRSELSQQQALLEIVVELATRIDQLRNQASGSDILVLLDENLSQTERIRAVLSDTRYSSTDELAAIKTEIELLKSMVMRSAQQPRTPVAEEVAAPWALGPSTIQYVQAMDSEAPGLVAITTDMGASVVLRTNESVHIAGKTILLDSVKPASNGRIGIYFVVDGQLKTVYYPR